MIHILKRKFHMIIIDTIAIKMLFEVDYKNIIISIQMEDYTIKILKKGMIETPISIGKLKLTKDIWSDKITPWEKRRIFRDFKLTYNIGNKQAPITDTYLNFNAIYPEIHRIKKLVYSKKRLALRKGLNKMHPDLCDDIINVIVTKINKNI